MLTNATERLGFPELFDAREATTNVMANDRRAIVERVGDSLRRYHFGPTAIVATDDAVFGMARMYAMLTDEGGGHQS